MLVDCVDGGASVGFMLPLSLERAQAFWRGLTDDVVRAAGNTVLVLDTASPEAERIYSRLGWVLAGEIADSALLPQGGLCSTRLYYRKLL